jgi:Ca2+-binding EF-hand superfamily protein
MIDTDKDGFITKDDLQDTFASLGKIHTDEYLESMLNEASGPLNFTMFLTLLGVKLNGTDPEEVIQNALSCLDDCGDGRISEEYLRDMLTLSGDRFTNEEADRLLNDLPIQNGTIDKNEICYILKNGRRESTK